MTESTGRRRYDSSRRAAQAQATSADIARAARRLFVAHGWAATTVRDVAREAGVSVPTVYATYGTKGGLARALVEASDLAADSRRQRAELDAAAGDPRRQLAAMAGYDRRLFQRAGDVIVLVREAGRSEPDLATTYRDARRRGDETRLEVFSAWPPDTLRVGLDVPTAVDVYAAVCTIDVYTTLTEERGWEPERVERWWADALSRELLA
jgi:TetR/AcrR family transcriptional regulator, regulator of cefoperazone and chloramphenicol sensitivity